eukprot:scaffold154713_cov23-Tisochrysis_lutea.AAC.1
MAPGVLVPTGDQAVAARAVPFDEAPAGAPVVGQPGGAGHPPGQATRLREDRPGPGPRQARRTRPRQRRN